MTQAIAIQEERAPAQVVASESSAIISMIERAARDPSVDVDKFERLMAMSERVQAAAAKKSFNAAVTAAKGEIGPIMRTATGHNEKKYADFSAYARAVDPVLARHGLGYRFRTEQTDRINVTCVLFHEAGHSEDNTLSGPPDNSGNKNAIQSIGSTLTYLQRYSLIQSLGLASEKDDDGKAASGKPVDETPVTEEQANAIRKALEFADADEGKFLAYIKVGAVEDILAAKFDTVMALIRQRKAKAEKKVKTDA